MTRFVVCLAGGLAFTIAVTSAQGPPANAGLADMLRQNYNGLKNNVIGSAEKMPEADFASKPSSMPEVRTFAQLFGHIANAQFNQCAAARGVPNPQQGVNLEEKTSKADVTKVLADVFAFCDPAFQSLTDQSALELVPRGSVRWRAAASWPACSDTRTRWTARRWPICAPRTWCRLRRRTPDDAVVALVAHPAAAGASNLHHTITTGRPASPGFRPERVEEAWPRCPVSSSAHCDPPHRGRRTCRTSSPRATTARRRT